jgi:hypothetical protein
LDRLEEEFMGEVSKSPATERPSSRAIGHMGLLLIVQAIFNLHNGLETHETWRVGFYAILSPLAALVWVLHTMRCLEELRLSRLWILPTSLPISFVAFSLFEGWRIVSLVALAVAFLLQVLIAIRKPSQLVTPINATITGGPSA